MKPATFIKMLSILQKEFNVMHKNGGKPPKLTPEAKLYVTLKYLREYRTMDSIAAEYGVCKGTVCLAIQWLEDILVKDGEFALPGKKVLKRKSHQPTKKEPKGLLFRQKTPHVKNTGYNREEQPTNH